MGIQFKFRDASADNHRQEIIRAVEQTGAGATVRPLFPGETDPELALLYRVEGLPEERQGEVIDLLTSSDEVDFAEPDARRKLIR